MKRFIQPEWALFTSIIVSGTMGLTFIEEIFIAGNFMFLLELIPYSIILWIGVYIAVPIAVIFIISMILLPLSPVILFVYLSWKFYIFLRTSHIMY